MPLAIVSSEPALCVQAMRGMVDDAERLLGDRGIAGKDTLVVGLSVGTYPATYLANRIGARLCSAASADRADLACGTVQPRASSSNAPCKKVLRLEHYAEALDGTHPAQNLAGIAENSVFVVGQRDPFIPPPCHSGLLAAVESCAPSAQVVTLNAGHFRT
jgi:pimeloyl-ACP methyl ester carboxylesterase